MNRIRHIAAVTAAAMQISLLCAAQTAIPELLSQLEWAKPDVGRKVIAEFLKRGEAAVAELTKLLDPPGKDSDDAKVRFALHGMAVATMTGKAEAQRAVLAKGLITALNTRTEPEVRAFLIRQLQLCGRDEAIPPLAALLADDRFCEPATQALIRIGTPNAITKLRKALGKAEGKHAVTLALAVGQLRDAESSETLLKLAKHADPTIARAARYALANIAPANALTVLEDAAKNGSPIDRPRDVRQFLLFARRRAESGATAETASLCRRLAADDALPAHARTGALTTLVDAVGTQALPDLAKAAQSQNHELREGALRLAAKLPADETVETFAPVLQAATQEDVRAAIVAMLGRTGSPAAAPSVQAALADPAAAVRHAAIRSLPKVSGPNALALLVGRMAGTDDSDIAVAKETLRWVSAEGYAAALAAGLPKASPKGKAALLALLASRNAADQVDAVFAMTAEQDRDVKKAALNALETVARTADVPRLLDLFAKTDSASVRQSIRTVLVAVCRHDAAAIAPILAAEKSAAPAVRGPLLGVLAKVGGDGALKAVVANLGSTNKALQDAAVRALADWKDTAAAPHLLTLAKQDANEIHRVLAFRGYVSLVGKEIQRNAGQGTEMLKQALKVAKKPDEKKRVMGALGGIRHDPAVGLLAQQLDDPALVNETAAAIVKTVTPHDKKDRGFNTAPAIAALEKVVAVCKTASIRDKAKSHLASLPPTAGRTNLALEREVKASVGQQGARSPEGAVDGKLGKLDAWFGATWPCWYQVDLGVPQTIDMVRIIYYWDGRRYYQYTVEASLDGKTWKKVADNSKNSTAADEQGLSHRFDSTEARYVRLNILKNSVNEAVHVVEFEVYLARGAKAKTPPRLPKSHGNLTEGKPVTISCKPEVDAHKAEFAVDGKLDRGSAFWGDKWPSYLQVDLQEPAEIDTLRVIFHWDGKRYYQYTMSLSLDGETWTQVVDAAKNTNPGSAMGFVHRIKPTKTRYIRLDTLKATANHATHVVELEAYAAGKAPQTFRTSEPPRPPAPKAAPPPPPLPKPDKDGFIPLFNGKDLTGWVGSVNGYGAEDGVLFCKSKGGGKLMTAHQFGDFVLHLDFRFPPGANNGLAIRAPLAGNASYNGMELQIIDNEGYEKAHKYKLQPWQVHGSIYGVVPAKTGALKPANEWNHQEVRAIGRQITVILNGTTIVDADLSTITETADGKGLEKHPGLARHKGHIGFLGHGARVEFKNIRIKPIPPYTTGPMNIPPPGFIHLFDGKSLAGWKGLVASPEKRAKMTPEQLAGAQKNADDNMRKHWSIEDDALAFDGKGHSLCTAKDYGDFEMLVDWKIQAGGDSGIYLRGSPQVQIWDPARRPEGSAGLFNNKKNPSKPSLCADNPIGQWNRFRIKMIGEKVTVWLNGELVVDNVTMENYWNRAKPIYPTGQLELQSHGSKLRFRNIYLREIPRDDG